MGRQRQAVVCSVGKMVDSGVCDVWILKLSSIDAWVSQFLFAVTNFQVTKKQSEMDEMHLDLEYVCLHSLDFQLLGYILKLKKNGVVKSHTNVQLV